MIASAKQAFRAPMTIRAGDREVIKVRQFVRVATNLSLTTGAYATDIPPFNPLRLFAEESGERYVEPRAGGRRRRRLGRQARPRGARRRGERARPVGRRRRRP